MIKTALIPDLRGSSRTSHLGGKVSLRLELFKEGGQEESGEEENDGPEENIWDVGPVMATCRSQEFPLKLGTHLGKREHQVSAHTRERDPTDHRRSPKLTETLRLFQGMESGVNPDWFHCCTSSSVTLAGGEH